MNRKKGNGGFGPSRRAPWVEKNILDRDRLTNGTGTGLT